MRINRISFGLLVGAVFGLLPSAPAGAVLGGTIDTANRFENVGRIELDGDFLCSGTLYRTSPDQTTSNLVLTAGHCTSDFTGTFRITFDPTPGPDSVYYTGTPVTFPGSTFPDMGRRNSLSQFATVDVGVLVLDEAPAGITPADLPSVGLVDTLGTKAEVTVVGYGINAFQNANVFSAGVRTWRDAEVVPGQRHQLASQFLKVSQAQCFGDSGGPQFLAGTNVILAVISWGQSWVCKSTSYGFRIDSPEVLAFLRDPTGFVAAR